MSDIAERSLRTRAARSVEALRRSFTDNLFYLTGRSFQKASPADLYTALAFTVRDRMLERSIITGENYKRSGARAVCYLSAEFMLGPHLGNNILNLGLRDALEEALRGLGFDLESLVRLEQEPGLGNGGLGRLAACYLDSLATLEYPAIGYGIRYEFGMFDQAIRDGWLVEVADTWLRDGNPWELPNRARRYPVKFGGHTEQGRDAQGRLQVRWVPESTVYGVAYDTPILGYGVMNVNLLRLWKAEAQDAFDFEAFNQGDYWGAVEDMVAAENLSKVLYPNDQPEGGKALRLKQQYFFVSCSLQDMARIVLRDVGDLGRFAEKFVAQLNDTHPAIAIPELMRLLVDEQGFAWEPAWEITRQSFAYTNHTLLPEALETWPVDLFRRILPRHLEIIEEIDRRFLDEVRVRFMEDTARLARMSLVGEGRVRMAHLAAVGSYAINGVAALHSELLKTTVLRDFHELWPEKFTSVTNGVTPRRFIALANPPLAGLIEETLDGDWLRHLESLRRLEAWADDPVFQLRWREVKTHAKQRLAHCIRETTGIEVDPTSLFDIQAKRIHEYKRQHLNVLHIVSQYCRLKNDPNLPRQPRTFVFGGKAAPGYGTAKLIIKLIHAVADVINRDPDVRDAMRVVFIPDFNVKTAQYIYPAADLSEQISTAGKEASGTGNMKFSMNGALTIGTLDGANVEIRDAVGADNFFLFGLTAEEVRERLAAGYRPGEIIDADPELQHALDLIDAGYFSHGDGDLFAPVTRNLREADPWFVCADYRAYMDCQEQVDAAYADPAGWTRKSILNVARMGHFSSDRAIREYATRIWRVLPVKVKG